MDNLGNLGKMTILYERLSRDDDFIGDSNSIANQKFLLEDYAEHNGLAPYEHLTDDGFSGTNYDRPAWQELIAKIECGAKMYNNRSRNLSPITKPNGRLYQPPPRDAYTCSTYLNAKYIRHCACEANAIQTHIITRIILDVIRETAAFAQENEKEFLQKLREMPAVQQNETAKSHKRKLAKNEKRLADLKTLFKKTYEDNAIGKLSDDLFEELKTDYERERGKSTFI